MHQHSCGFEHRCREPCSKRWQQRVTALAATLSTTIRCCEARSDLPSIFPRPRPRLASRSPSALAASPPRSAQELGVYKEAINFVLPIGCTVNMDGGALERPLVVLWIAHVAGCPLAFGQQLEVALTAALLSVGSSPIPSAGASRHPSPDARPSVAPRPSPRPPPPTLPTPETCTHSRPPQASRRCLPWCRTRP